MLNPEELTAERLRFNALTPEDAKKLLEAAEGKTADFRSCWYCNGAHERLKNRELLFCFACGNHYIKGYPSPAVYRRSEGKEITEQDMKLFNEGLEES